MHDQRMTRLQAVNRFNSTSSLQLVGGYYLERVKTYANFDYAESANDGSSITGYYVFLGNT